MTEDDGVESNTPASSPSYVHTPGLIGKLLLTRIETVEVYMGAPDKSHEEIVRAEFTKLLREDHPGGIDEMPLAELGIDSLDFFEKILYLEDEFGISIPIQELDNDITLQKLLTVVKR